MTTQRTSAEGNSPINPINTVNLNDRVSTSKKTGRWLWFWLGMSGIAMVSATAGALLAYSLTSQPLMQADLSVSEQAVFGQGKISGAGLRFSELTRPVNILVMGMSVLPPDTQNAPEDVKKLGYLPQVNSFDGLADVMLLIRFNPETKKMTMLSIPRDTRIRIDGYGKRKINSANVYGGPALTAKTTSKLLGDVAIDRYIRINVLGVGKLIDALGGVNVYVPKDMKYHDHSQHLYIDLKKGQQHLDGEKALQLLRYRHDENGDIGRIQRQQMVIRSLKEQALNPATIGRLPQILNAVKENIDTNLNVEEILALAGFGVRTNRSNTQMLMLPGRFSRVGEFNASYWIPYPNTIKNMMVQYFGLQDENPAARKKKVKPASLRVAIQNATGEEDVELQPLVNQLIRSGYGRVYIAKHTGKPLNITNVVAQSGDREGAESVRNTLGFGEVSVESTGYLGSDISIKVGRDWFQNQSLLENEIDSTYD